MKRNALIGLTLLVGGCLLGCSLFAGLGAESPAPTTAAPVVAAPQPKAETVAKDDEAMGALGWLGLSAATTSALYAGVRHGIPALVKAMTSKPA